MLRTGVRLGVIDLEEWSWFCNLLSLIPGVVVSSMKPTGEGVSVSFMGINRVCIIWMSSSGVVTVARPALCVVRRASSVDRISTTVYHVRVHALGCFFELIATVSCTAMQLCVG